MISNRFQMLMFAAMCGLICAGISVTQSAAQGKGSKSNSAEATGQEVQPAEFVYLSQAMAVENKGPLKVVDNRSWSGGPISIGGKTFQRGLGVHAESKLTFPLDKKYKSFQVVAGPDDGATGVVQMRIFIGKRLAYDSGAIHSRDKKQRRTLRFSVQGASRLTLEVLRADGKRDGDHACWADARLELQAKQARAIQRRQAKSTGVPKAKLQPFFQKYCVQCHGPDQQEAGVRFDKTQWRIDNNDSAQRWQDVLDQLNSGDMPPPGEDEPEQEELAGAMAHLTRSLVVARRRLTDHGGEIKLRRLNRREYANSIKHLFGFDVPHDLLPEDGEFTSFDTVGEEQLFNSAHFDKYLQVGEEIGRRALYWNTRRRKETTTKRTEPEREVTEELREKLADLDRKMEMKKAGKNWKEMGFKDEGQAKIIFSQFNTRAGNPRRYLEYPLVDQGIYLTEVKKWGSVNRHTDIRADYLVRIRAGAIEAADELRKFVRVTDRWGFKAALQIQGTPDQPETVEFRTRQAMGRSLMSIEVRENMPGFSGNTFSRYLKSLQGKDHVFDPWASIWIDYLEIEGPFYPEQRPWFEELLYPNQATGSRKSPLFRKDAKAKQFIQKFAFEAFRRRTPVPEYIDALHQRFLAKRKAGGSYDECMAEIIGIVLASPGFLYLHEDTDPLSRELDSRELAVRLSYFLWSSPPDQALYQCDLLNQDVLRQQVERMLGDPRSKAFLNGFVDQWAELDRFDAITVEKQYFRFNRGVQESAKREVREFFGTLLKENLPASNLIDSDFVVVNPLLANHYGIPRVDCKTDAFQRVPLPEDSPRGGLMTQAAFLITGSNGERSSPVIRGALVLEKLLHDKPAPPPPNVPELGAASRKPRTNREMVKMHQQQAVCASCHRKMDVIGFGLENFDTIGSWRDVERVGRKNVAIDSSGVLPDGEKFADVQELKQLLLAEEDSLVRELTESILAYGLGRTVEFSDAQAVEDLMVKIKKDKNRVRAIVREIAISELFKRK